MFLPGIWGLSSRPHNCLSLPAILNAHRGEGKATQVRSAGRTSGTPLPPRDCRVARPRQGLLAMTGTVGAKGVGSRLLRLCRWGEAGSNDAGGLCPRNDSLDSRFRGNHEGEFPPEADRGFGGVPQFPSSTPKSGGQGVDDTRPKVCCFPETGFRPLCLELAVTGLQPIF
jgi:hypothetical protein